VESSVLVLAVAVGVSVPLLLTAIATTWYCCVARAHKRTAREGEVELKPHAQPPQQPDGAAKQLELHGGFDPVAASAYGGPGFIPPSVPSSIGDSAMMMQQPKSEASAGYSDLGPHGTFGAAKGGTGKLQPLVPLVPPASPPASLHSEVLPPPPMAGAGPGGFERDDASGPVPGPRAPGAVQQPAHARVGEASCIPAQPQPMVIAERDADGNLVAFSDSRWRAR
jgi:hypothetical protein